MVASIFTRVCSTCVGYRVGDAVGWIRVGATVGATVPCDRLTELMAIKIFNAKFIISQSFIGYYECMNGEGKDSFSGAVE